MKYIPLILLILVASWLVAKPSYGASGIGPIAPTVDLCPPPLKGYAFMCPVGTTTTGYNMYISYSGEPYALFH